MGNIDKRKKFDKLRKHFDNWRSMQGEVHTLSPCDPRKIKFQEDATEWKRILSSDPELFDMLQEVEDFEEIFMLDEYSIS